MQNYIIAYHTDGSTPETTEKGAADREQWGAWVKGLGDSVVNPGTPLTGSTIITANGISEVSGSLTGYSVVKANSLDAALEMAAACPYLVYGTVEVAEMKEM